jgi:hypothetical protein
VDILKHAKFVSDLLDRYDSSGLKVAHEFFVKHGLTDFDERMKFEYGSDFGQVTSLKSIYVDVFKLDSKRFIRFHDNMWRKRQVPHFEDAIIMATLIVAILGLIVSPIVGVEYQLWRQRHSGGKEDTSANDREDVAALFKYVLVAYALREAYRSKKIKLSDFKKLKARLEQEADDTEVVADSRLLEIWSAFNDTDIPLGPDVFIEMENISAKVLESPRTRKKGDRVNPTQTAIDLPGLGVSPGQVSGVARKPSSAAVCKPGEIAIFEVYGPHMIPFIKQCAGAIGSERCGGRLGHLAIVARTIGVPCGLKLMFRGLPTGNS